MKYVFLGSGRCFHTEDWYKSAKTLFSDRSHSSIMELFFITDQLTGEGDKTFLIEDDNILTIFVIDRMLFRSFSRLGSVWRNILKLLVLPLQIFLLRKVLRNLGPDVVIHAHSTYYAFLASFSGCKYISTPQGSEVLVRLSNLLYRKFAYRAHRLASFVTVDSKSMQEKMKLFLGITPKTIQNGIAIDTIQPSSSISRKNILSIRGFFPNYQIEKLLLDRNQSSGPALRFCFPFYDAPYLENLKPLMRDDDVMLGKLSRQQFHHELSNAKVVISIPFSDSSPRSVYESIFSGAVAIVCSNGYLSELPSCMRSRIVEVDVSNEGWLCEALQQAEFISKTRFVASEEAKEKYDQKHSMKLIVELAKNI